MKKIFIIIGLSLILLSNTANAVCYTISNLSGGNVSKTKNFGFSSDKYSDVNFYIEDLGNNKIYLDTTSLENSYKDYRIYKLNNMTYEAFFSEGQGISKIDFSIDPQSGKVIYQELKSGWGVIDGAKIMIGDLINTTDGSCPRN